MTYSICARDPDTGALGVAVQTCMFAVGSQVPWARAGVGAVATQAFGEPAYGPRCLEALVEGQPVDLALANARDLDPAAVMRQVGVVAATGAVAAFTGDMCIPNAGHLTGDGFTVQGNMLASAEVWPTMAAAYASSPAPFAERLLHALLAGEEAGGDARGSMSAAMLIVAGEAKEGPTDGVLVDLRVDAHERPLDELARLLRGRFAFDHYFRAVELLGAGDVAATLAEIQTAHDLLPDDENIAFLRAGALLFNGRADESRAVLRELVARRPSWATIVRGFVAKGLFPLPEGVDVEALLGG